MFDVAPYISSLESPLELSWFWASFAAPDDGSRRVGIYYPPEGEPFAIRWIRIDARQPPEWASEHEPVETEEQQRAIWEWLLGKNEQ